MQLSAQTLCIALRSVDYPGALGSHGKLSGKRVLSGLCNNPLYTLPTNPRSLSDFRIPS